MHWILLAIATYLAAVIETSCADLLAIGGIAPDLLALVLVVRLLVGPARHQLGASFAVGLVADLTTPAQAGIGLASFLAMGWLVARYGARTRPSGVPGGVLTVLLAVSFAALLAALARQLLGETEPSWSALPAKSFAVGAYTAAFALPVLMAICWLREPSPLLRRA
jgi:rod shape-determining protein MreD